MSDTASRSLKLPQRWKSEEDHILRREVERYADGKPISWTKVATALRDRGKDDCRKRWAKIDGQWRKGAWDKAEDDRLRRAVKDQGNSWTKISNKVGTRSPDQCAKHWRNSLDPNNVRKGWTENEDSVLNEAVKLHGHDWKLIREKYLSQRSNLDLSNRHASLCRQQRTGTSPPYPLPEEDSEKQDKRRPEPAGSIETALSESGINVPWERRPFHDEILRPPSKKQKSGAPPLSTSWPGNTDTPSASGLGDNLLYQDIQNVESSWANDMSLNDMDLFQEATNSGDGLQPPTNLRSLFSPSQHADVQLQSSQSNYGSKKELGSDNQDLGRMLNLDNTYDKQTLSPRSEMFSSYDSCVESSSSPSNASSLASTSSLTRKSKTILTVENLDPDTRAKILNLLCDQKMVTTIEIF